MYCLFPSQYSPPESNETVPQWIPVKVHSGLWRTCVYNEDSEGKWDSMGQSGMDKWGRLFCLVVNSNNMLLSWGRVNICNGLCWCGWY